MKRNEASLKKIAERDVLGTLKPKSELVSYAKVQGVKKYGIKDTKTGKVKTYEVFPHK